MERNNFVITRANHDDVTSYLFHWTKEVIAEAEKRGFIVFDLPGNRATKGNFESIVGNKDPRFILLNGHGKADTITGQDRQNIVLLNDNHDVLKSRIVYARSCWAASGIGKKCEEIDPNGYGCFIGYMREYAMEADQNSMTRPLHDEFAKPFMASSNVIAVSILKGNTVKEALQKSENMMKKYIEYYDSSDAPGSSNISMCLRWNLMNQTYCGNGEVTIDS